MSTKAGSKARQYASLLSGKSATLVTVDFQSGLCRTGLRPVAGESLYAALTLARAARLLDVALVATILDTGASRADVLPQFDEFIDPSRLVRRSEINPWEYPGFVEVIEEIGHDRLVVLGHSPEISVAVTVLSALEEGYDTYFVFDALTGHPEPSCQAAVTRMVQAGAVPVGWRQLMFEWLGRWPEQDHLESPLPFAEFRRAS